MQRGIFPAPCSLYSGERVGERGERRATSDCVRFVGGRSAANRTRRDSTRTLPLSPALSPAYREEGVKCARALVADSFPQRILDRPEIPETPVQFINQLLDVLRIRLRVFQRIPQRRRRVGHVIRAVGEVAR